MRWLLAMALVSSGACDGALHRMQDREARPEIERPDGVVAWIGSQASDVGSGAGAVDRALIARGQDRFDRFCAACHGVLGDGDSVVAHAMSGPRPRSLVDADAVRLDDARVLRAMTIGYGAMPALADALPARDRFAVLQFVRALQHREVAVDAHPEAARWLR